MLMADPIILYAELAAWWPLLSAPSDYAEEAAYYDAALREHCVCTPRTLLELGSGDHQAATDLQVCFGHLASPARPRRASTTAVGAADPGPLRHSASAWPPRC